MNGRIDHLLGQGAAIDQHGIDAARLGCQRDDRAIFRSQIALDDFGHLGGTGEDHARYAFQSNERSAYRFPRAMQNLQCIFGHAGCMQQLGCFDRDCRRLLGGFGEHRIAGGQRCSHLA